MLRPRPRQRRHFLLFSLPLLFNLLSAEDPLDPIFAEPPTTISAFTSNLPLASNNVGYAPNKPENTNTTMSGDGDDDRQDGLLNYYFLLLAVFIIVVLVIYWSLSRQRKANLARRQSTQQDALALDVTGSGWRSAPGRWRRHYGGSRDLRSREEEGLNERGEAPPPYLKEPEAVHVNGRAHVDGVELMPWSRGGLNVKPPDYEERVLSDPVNRRDTDARGPP